jgi:hypothetical protein
VVFKIFLSVFLLSVFANAESALDIAVRNTQAAHNQDYLRQQEARRLLELAIEGTDVSTMTSEQAQEAPVRYTSRKGDTGSELLNKVTDQTIKESNPAIAGKDTPVGRPLVLYRDVDPADVFVAKEIGSGDKKIVVYKSKDLRGRDVYKTLDGNVSNAIIEKKLFPKEEVIIRDEAGKLQKVYPKAIYADGTLEVKDQSGFTTRRAPGRYHLTDSVKIPKLQNFEEDKTLSAKERKALEALRKAYCDL